MTEMEMLKAIADTGTFVTLAWGSKEWRVRWATPRMQAIGFMDQCASSDPEPAIAIAYYKIMEQVNA